MPLQLKYYIGLNKGHSRILNGNKMRMPLNTLDQIRIHKDIK